MYNDRSIKMMKSMLMSNHSACGNMLQNWLFVQTWKLCFLEINYHTSLTNIIYKLVISILNWLYVNTTLFLELKVQKINT